MYRNLCWCLGSNFMDRCWMYCYRTVTSGQDSLRIVLTEGLMKTDTSKDILLSQATNSQRIKQSQKGSICLLQFDKFKSYLFVFCVDFPESCENDPCSIICLNHTYYSRLLYFYAHLIDLLNTQEFLKVRSYFHIVLQFINNSYSIYGLIVLLLLLIIFTNMFQMDQLCIILRRVLCC